MRMTVSRYVSGSSVRLAIEEHGQGDPLLLLHGSLADRDQVLDMASCLTAKRRLVAYTARGQGDSSRQAADHSLDSYVGDMASVANAITAAPLVVGGGSMGAAVALAFALRFPERVRALVQIGPAYDEAGLAPAVRALAEPAAHLVSSGGFAALREAIVTSGMPEASRSQLVAEVDRWEGAFTPESFAARAEALVSWRPASGLEKLDVPVLVVAWPDDDQHPLSIAQQYAEKLPNAELVEVGAHASDGRSANTEICAALSRFLASVESAVHERASESSSSRSTWSR